MELLDKIHSCQMTRDVAREQLILEFQPVDDPEATLGFRRWLRSGTSSRHRIPTHIPRIINHDLEIASSYKN